MTAVSFGGWQFLYTPSYEAYFLHREEKGILPIPNSSGTVTRHQGDLYVGAGIQENPSRTISGFRRKVYCYCFRGFAAMPSMNGKPLA